MAVSPSIRPHYQNQRRGFLPTPYASLPAAFLDTTADRGAWECDSLGYDGARTHRIVGSVSDAMEFGGQISSWIQIPDDLWKADTGLSFTWTLAGCVVDPSCIGTGSLAKLHLSLPNSNSPNDNSVDYTLPDCPSFSSDITQSGPITFGISSGWKNPFVIVLRTPVPQLGSDCNITVAHLNFVVSSTGGAGNGSVSSTASETTATIIHTAINTTRAGYTTEPAVVSSNNGSGIGSDGLTLTTKAPLVSTLTDGGVITIAARSETLTSQTLSAAGSSYKAKMAGVIGGILGALALILLAAFLLWWRRRKASRRWKDGNVSFTEGLNRFDDSVVSISKANVAVTATDFRRHIPPSSPIHNDTPPIYHSEQSPSWPLSAQTSGDYRGVGLGPALVPSFVADSEDHSQVDTGTSDFHVDSGPYSTHLSAFHLPTRSQIHTQTYRTTKGPNIYTNSFYAATFDKPHTFDDAIN